MRDCCPSSKWRKPIDLRPGRRKTCCARRGRDFWITCAKEDIELYPVLKVAAITNSSIKEILDMFSVDMAETLKLAVVFFKKCEQAGAGLDLAADGGHLLALLRIRIRREEEMLYPLYESLAKKAA